jgi:hypothetical protein
VAQVGGDTRSVDHIPKGNLVDERRDLAEERQRLLLVSTCILRRYESNRTWPMPPEAPRIPTLTMLAAVIVENSVERLR